jgi:hypothetical protein
MTLRTNRVSKTIVVADQRGLLRELTALHSILRTAAEITLSLGPAIGDRCQILAGPLRGIQGVVVARANRAKLVLQVDVLQMGAAVEIDADLLESLEYTRHRATA